MRKKLSKIIAYFLVGILTIQFLFYSGGDKVNASHSENATLMFSTKMRLYAQYKAVDASLPAPFNTGMSTRLSAILIKDAGKDYYSTGYCIGYDKAAVNNDGLKSNLTLPEDQAGLLNYTMLKGYNKEKMDLENATEADTNKYFATQVLIWIIKENQFFNDSTRGKVEAYFFKAFPSIQNDYKELYKQVKYYAMKPSYIDGSEKVLEYNEQTKKYELKLKNTAIGEGLSANTNVKVDEASLQAGVKVEINGEDVLITSEKEISSAQTIKFIKKPTEKGKIIAWTNNDANRQPQSTLDYDEEAIPTYMELKIKTNKKVETPSSETPKTETPQSQTPSPETPKPEVKQPTEKKIEVEQKLYTDESTDKLDDAPKTADESNIQRAVALCITSLAIMIVTSVIILVKKKRL